MKLGDRVPIPPAPTSEREIMKSWTAVHDSPVVSVICHTYNHERFIRDALNGFLMQKTDFPFEILIHDDASTDGTAGIIEEYCSLFPGLIRCIRQAHNIYSKGRSPMEYTYPAARGRYIALCEGDDYWLDAKKLQKQLDHVKSRSGLVLSYHDAIVVDDMGVCVSFNRAEKSIYSRHDLKKAPFIPTLTRLFEKKEFPWLGDKRPPIANDVLMVSQLGQYGAAVFTKDVIPAVYRKHAGGVWSQRSNIEKARVSTDAFLFMAQKYAEKNEEDISDYFLMRSFKVWVFLVGPSRTMFFVLSSSFNYMIKKIRSGFFRGRK